MIDKVAALGTGEQVLQGLATLEARLAQLEACRRRK